MSEQCCKPGHPTECEIERLVLRAENWKRAAFAGQDDLVALRAQLMDMERRAGRFEAKFDLTKGCLEDAEAERDEALLRARDAEALLAQTLQALHDATERERRKDADMTDGIERLCAALRTRASSATGGWEETP